MARRSRTDSYLQLPLATLTAFWLTVLWLRLLFASSSSSRSRLINTPKLAGIQRNAGQANRDGGRFWSEGLQPPV